MKKIIAALMAITFSITGIVSAVPAFAAGNLGERLSRDGWNVTASSVTSSDWGGASKMLDGNLGTYWHSAYTASGSTITGHDEAPYTLNFDMGKKQKISGIGYIPRQDSTNGYWNKIQVYTSEDGKKYNLVAEDTYTYNGADKSEKTTAFGKNVNARYIRVIVTETPGYGMAAEFYAYGAVEIKTAVVVVNKDTSASTAGGSGKAVLPLENKTANINGSSQTLPEAAQVINGATMVPLKAIVEAFGGTYSESGEDISVSYNNANYNLKKNSNYLTINGIRGFMSKPTVVINDTVMASVLLFTNNMGLTGSLNQAEKTIILSK